MDAFFTSKLLLALGTGLAAGMASVPHCVAMCGPVAAFACRGRKVGAAPIRYQAGRMLSYSALGAAAGHAGAVATAALSDPWTAAFLSWSLAAALLFAAYRLWRLGQAPERAARAPHERLISLRKRPTAAPAEAGSAGRWNATSTRAGARLSGVLSLLGREPGLVGVGTAFLPCGALAGALVLAAGSSSAPTGGAVMLGFATTSGLGLLGVGWLAKRLRVHRRGVLVRVLAVVLTIGGIMLAIRPVDALRGQPAACCEAEGHG